MQTLQLFTRDNHYNYFRGEVDFDDELDDIFKIQTNKSRYDVPMRLQNLIRDRCLNTINEIARDSKKESNRLKIRKQKLESPKAEVAQVSNTTP